MAKKRMQPPPLISVDGGTPTPVPDWLGMTAQLNQIASYVAQIPEVRSLAEAANEGNIRVEERVKALDDRVTRVETKLEEGHDCSKVNTLQRLEAADVSLGAKMQEEIQGSIKHREKLSQVTLSLEKANEAIARNAAVKRQLWIGTLGILLTVLTGMGGAIWFLATLNTEVSRDRSESTKQFNGITTQIKTLERNVHSSWPALEDQIRSLENSVHKNSKSGSELDGFRIWYNHLSSAQKTRLMRSFPKADFERWSGGIR